MLGMGCDLPPPPRRLIYGNTLCCPCCPYMGMCLCITPSVSCQVLGGECNGQQGQPRQGCRNPAVIAAIAYCASQSQVPAWLNIYEDRDLRFLGVK